MKPESALRSFLCIAGSSLLAVSAASANTYYWDSNDGAAGFGTTAGTWVTPTLGTLTGGFTQDATGETVVDGNSVTTTTADTVNFGTNSSAYTGGITFSGTVNVGSIYLCPTHSTTVSAISSPVINFAATGIFETARDTTFGLPALTITGAATSLTWRSTRTLQLVNITSNITSSVAFPSKYILQTSPDSLLPYPGRVAVNAAAQLGPVGTALEFDGGTLRMIGVGTPAVIPYTSLSALNTDHPVTFMPNMNAGFDLPTQNTTFTVDLPMNLGTGKFFAEGRNAYDSTIKLTQSNTMAETLLTSGTLEISDSSNLGAITSPLRFGTGTVTLLSGCLRIAGTTMTSLGARPVNTTDGKPVAFDIAEAGNTFTLDKVLTQANKDGTFIKYGLGTLILSGNNSYGGPTTVSGGTLRLGNANALGFGGVMNSTVAGTTVSTGFTLDLNGTTGINEPITVNGTGISANGALINSSGTPASIGSGISQATVAATGSGSGYSSAPVVAISGTGATATASLGVTAATFGITSGGSYTTKPTAAISGGGGTGATVTLLWSASSPFTITGFTVTAAGSGYTSAPTITLSGGVGTAADLTTNATNFCVGGLAMTAAGSGYTGTPSFTFDAIAATVTPTLSSVILATNSSIGGSGDIAINAVVSESGGSRTLTKVGDGTLLLNGINTYTGLTTVSAGTLGGTGTIAGSVSLAAPGSLAPGASAGTLAITGALDISAQANGGAGKLKFELGSIAASDKITVGGLLTLGTLDFTDFEFSTLSGLVNDTYTLISYGSYSGTFTPSGGTIGTGPATGTLQLNETSKTIELVVAGVGVGGSPEIDVNQGIDIANGGSKGFGTVTLGSNTPLIFTINNTGDAALNLLGTAPDYVAVSGTNAADFTVTSQPTTPVAGPGSSNFTVQFAPLGTLGGPRNAVLTILNNDSDEGTFTINVSGTAQTPYEAWAGGALFFADANGDGVDNGLAFLLGAANATSAVTQPTVTQSGGNLILSNFLSRNNASRGTATLYVQHSSDLGIGDPWVSVPVTDAGTAASGVTFSVTPGVTNNTVTATISSSQAFGGKLFGRLNASPTP